ncbi:MarR family winged helix-turn-helix transcriptional regulator [Actinomycetes bacterium M1A6_2h]
MDEQDTTRWLTPEQQTAWRGLVTLCTRLPAALDTQLQRDSGLTHFDYFVLGGLSESPDRRLKLRDLAERSNASLSRLSHVITKLEKLGWVQRENIEGGRGSFAVLTDTGWEKVREAAPAHVETVQSLVFEGLDDAQVETLRQLGSVMLAQLDRGIAGGLGKA